MDAKTLVTLIIENTAASYSTEFKPDKIHSKDELIAMVELYIDFQSMKSSGLIELINKHWRFDESQGHISTWHDKQDLLKAMEYIVYGDLLNAKSDESIAIPPDNIVEAYEVIIADLEKEKKEYSRKDDQYSWHIVDHEQKIWNQALRVLQGKPRIEEVVEEPEGDLPF